VSASTVATGPQPAKRKRRRRRGFDEMFPRLSEEERAAALADPGPTWSEYFYRQFLKWWLGLAYFVLDVVLALALLNLPEGTLFAAVGLVVAVYLEFLLTRYLWYRPDPDKESRHQKFHPTWLRPTRFGRWTPEAEHARRGEDPFEGRPTGPDPSEFL
jgi:hypothetical protein